MDAAMLMSGMDQRYRLHAMCFVTKVYYRAPTAARKPELGATPNKTLGLEEKL
jgi:hypothetical protein